MQAQVFLLLDLTNIKLLCEIAIKILNTYFQFLYLSPRALLTESSQVCTAHFEKRSVALPTSPCHSTCILLPLRTCHPPHTGRACPLLRKLLTPLCLIN